MKTNPSDNGTGRAIPDTLIPVAEKESVHRDLRTAVNMEDNN